MGNKAFEEWMLDARDPQEIIERFKREGFKFGAHKAFQLARAIVKNDIILVSSLPDSFVEEIHLKPASSLEEAWEMARSKFNKEPRVTVVPHASSTLPVSSHR
jgi:nickel-dependent lactate racemase